MSAICKYLDYKKINIEFSDNYTLDNIPDEILVHLFDNIDNRIQLIDGNEYKDFIIIRRISDNKIFKSMIKTNNNDYSDESFDDSYDDDESTYSSESDYDNESDNDEEDNYQ